MRTQTSIGAAFRGPTSPLISKDDMEQHICILFPFCIIIIMITISNKPIGEHSGENLCNDTWTEILKKKKKKQFEWFQECFGVRPHSKKCFWFSHDRQSSCYCECSTVTMLLRCYSDTCTKLWIVSARSCCSGVKDIRARHPGSFTWLWLSWSCSVGDVFSCPTSKIAEGINWNFWKKYSLHTNLVQTFPDQVLNGKTGEALKAANLPISWQFGF